jgi:hypothetical protein
MKRPFFLYILVLLHLLLGITAAAGGSMLMLKPDGSLLSMPTQWLNHSFDDYLIPGVILFVMNGLLPLFVAISLLVKPHFSCDAFNIYPGRHWAWTYSLFTGIISIIWIVVQQLMTQYFWIQPVIILTGLCIIILTMLPGTIAYFEVEKKAVKLH